MKLFGNNLQKRAAEAEKETEKVHKKIDKLKKKHQKEVGTLNELVAEFRLPKEALQPAYDEEKHNAEEESHGINDQQWREEFQPFYKVDENDLSKLAEPSSWFTGYDRCNI